MAECTAGALPCPDGWACNGGITWGSFRDRVLQLMNLFSVRGRELPPEYSDLADVTLRMPQLLGSALLDIAGRTDLYLTDVPVSELATETLGAGPMRVYLPANFMASRSACFRVLRDRGGWNRDEMFGCSPEAALTLPLQPVNDAAGRWAPLPRRYAADALLHYHRRPRLPEIAPGALQDGTLLDGPPEALDAAACYTAAMLLTQDDPFSFTALFNIYTDRLSRLRRQVYAENTQVENVMTPGLYCF